MMGKEISEEPTKRIVSKCYLLSCVQLFATLWTIAHQATQSMEFSMQEYWCGQPYPFRGIEPGSPALQTDSSQSDPQGKPFLKVDTN